MIKQIFIDWIDSFKANDDGFSRKKMIAYTIELCILIAHIAWLKRAFMTDNFDLFPTILTLDFGVITALLGISAVQSVKNKQIDTNQLPTNEGIN